MVDNIKSENSGNNNESRMRVSSGEHVVRVRGLPWSDIIGIHFTYSKEGRPSGEAYLEFGSADDVDKALRHHREHMGQRYIEVFMSKRSEMEYVLQRSGKPFGLGTMENVVRLRGLPYNCSKDDIFLILLMMFDLDKIIVAVLVEKDLFDFRTKKPQNEL
ncbi:Heterogeneous nuclear ribonucleoprotein F [Trichinella pseudospiralis]|uniref:Heterogeneous nuclear ribonucleoprotein F n=1 Tax=Trichinella pseudospiralis TaxID=6337 RepID=A0A0V0YL51_TRIPS|nr:Heterogeneous nuclear ribonucleoprotein F [Trichinella pseudospiralis]